MKKEIVFVRCHEWTFVGKRKTFEPNDHESRDNEQNAIKQRILPNSVTFAHHGSKPARINYANKNNPEKFHQHPCPRHNTANYSFEIYTTSHRNTRNIPSKLMNKNTHPIEIAHFMLHETLLQHQKAF
jgi:hypothetical protein